MSYLADTNPLFVEAIKGVENNVILAKRRGEYKQTNGNGEYRWFPGKSPEGGLPTLAWGHKITPKEWETKRVHFPDTKLNQMVSKDFRYGLTDEEVHSLLLQDLRIREELAQSDWDKYLGAEKKMLWITLPDKYRGVLLNLTFNSYLVKQGKWVWTTVAQGILEKNDDIVTKGMVTTYKRPDGVKVKLTQRAIDIAKALGLPWKILLDKDGKPQT